ncbi:MAG: hypothetical protein AAFV53_21070 [Myxococcota bacterium]
MSARRARQGNLFVDEAQAHRARRYVRYAVGVARPRTVLDAAKLVHRWCVKWRDRLPNDRSQKALDARATLALRSRQPAAFEELVTEVWAEVMKPRKAGKR